MTMTLKNQFLPIYFSIIILTVLSACGHSQTNEPGLTIGTFSTLPPEIEGCSCYFSTDSTEFRHGVYIYINDFAQISFLKINGIMTEFTQIDFKKVDETTTIAKAKSELYEMTIEVKDGKQSGEETSVKFGKIKLTDKTGRTVTKTFYGECEC